MKGGIKYHRQKHGCSTRATIKKQRNQKVKARYCAQCNSARVKERNKITTQTVSEFIDVRPPTADKPLPQLILIARKIFNMILCIMLIPTVSEFWGTRCRRWYKVSKIRKNTRNFTLKNIFLHQIPPSFWREIGHHFRQALFEGLK